MKNRTLPYGYCCKDGVIVIEPQESKVLKLIFAAYLDGSSMLTIAEQLNRAKIEYRDGVTGWNKGRLKHLIDNTNASAQRGIRRSSTKQPMRKYRKQSMGATHKRTRTKHRTYSG